jgi:hypothetical protein
MRSAERRTWLHRHVPVAAAVEPRYPEPMTALAYRFAVNYVVYAMTH